MPRVMVVYEDSRGPQKNFGLHTLVLSMVSDSNGTAIEKLKGEVQENPMKGNGQVKETLEKNFQGGPLDDFCMVVAVFDEDRIRELYKLSSNASVDEIKDRIIHEAGNPRSLKVILLQRNMETVLEAARDCDPALPKERLEKALKKDLNARDAILNRIAWGMSKAIRDCIKARVPALEELRNLILSAL